MRGLFCGIMRSMRDMIKSFTYTVALGILFLAGSVFATVGGPTFIHTFKYNPQDESVYYIENDQNGRGCPPELNKISLNSGKSQVVYSCSEGEKLIEGNGYKFDPVYAEINKIISNFKDLTPINLKDNRISVGISLVDYEKMSPELDEISKANFIASVYQDGKKVIDLPVSGCNLKQPFVFAGYAIPGFDKKIVLLLSTKGDCWEGGYIRESLHVVGGVNNLDKEYYPNSYKESSALVPSEATLVVYSGEAATSTSTGQLDGEPGVTVQEGATPKGNNNIILYVAVIVVGLGLGYFFGRKKGV